MQKIYLVIVCLTTIGCSRDAMSAEFLSRIVHCFRVCSPWSYTVGHIDRLVLQKAAAEKGLETLQREIRTHQFVRTCLPKTKHSCSVYAWRPYVIRQVVKRSDTSPLAQAVFGQLDKMYGHGIPVSLPGNWLNACYQRGDFKTRDRIDYATYVYTPQGAGLGKANEVVVETKFYNKPNLYAAVKKL